MALEVQKILVPTDFSGCAQAALEQAAAIARQTGAELHLLHVMTSHDEDPYSLVYQISDPTEIYRQQEQLCGDRLEEILSDMPAEGLTVRSHLHRSFAVAPAILEVAGEQGIDLLVLGGHGRRGWRRFLLGSVAEEVVRLAACPVLTVRENSRLLDFGNLGRIVVPIDFSEHSRAALRTAKLLAGVDSRLALLHAVELPVLPHYYYVLHDTSERHAFQRISGQLLEAVTRLHHETEGPEVASEVKILEGSAADGIVTYAADADVDLIVIATHGLTGLKHLFLGSVAEKVVRSAACPVLTLKSAPDRHAALARPADDDRRALKAETPGATAS